MRYESMFNNFWVVTNKMVETIAFLCATSDVLAQFVSYMAYFFIESGDKIFISKLSNRYES